MILLEHLKYWAETHGDRVALVDQEGTRTTTYRELDALSDHVAERLQREGVRKGTAVLVRKPRGMEYIAEEIGILKCGCAYVPVLSEYPDDRVDYIREDSREIPTDTAMLVYTSGSTGKPKGVVYSKEALDAAVERMLPMMSDIDNLSFAAMAPQSFVSTLMEYWVVLSLGGTVHIISDDTRKDILRLQDYLSEHSITVANLVSRILPSYQNKDKALRRVFAGSERLTGCYSEDYEIVNLYGQSEGFLYSTFLVDKPYDNTPVGKPLNGVEFKVIDAEGNEVATGEEGEICVIGIFPSLYQNLPEQTAETFELLPDGRTLVHTKDIGKILPDGNLLYVNRKDWMVKINGQRVEPGEVEAAMMNTLPVSKAVVKHFTTDAGQIFLAGFYTGDEELEDSYIREQLAKNLPEYMIPTRFVHLEEFPSTVTGKVNRLALELPQEKSSKYIAPQTEQEQKLCDAFQSVLKCERVGATDDFFALGGDSIGVLHLQNQMNIVGLTPYIIYKGRTPRGISQLLSEQNDEDLFGKTMAEERDFYPMTFAQLAIYYQCYYNPEGSMYNNPFFVELDDMVDIDRLKTAWEKVKANHIVFKAEVMKDELGLPEFQTKSQGVEETKSRRVEELKELYRFEIKNGRIEMDFHHLIFDGTSLSVILQELSDAYEGKELEPEQVNPLKLGLYEQLLPDTEGYKRGHDIYREMFDGKDCDTMLPYEMEETDEDDIPCEEFTLAISGEDKKAIDALIDERKITANTLFMWAYQRTLSEVLGKQGVHFCTGYHGRMDSRLHNVAGMMVRTIPLYFEIDKDADFDLQLQQTSDCLQRAIEASTYPYAKVADEFGLEYRSSFVYQGDEYTMLSLGGKEYPVETIPVHSAQTDLLIMVFKYSDHYAIRFTYRSDCYKEATIRALADKYKEIILNDIA